MDKKLENNIIDYINDKNQHLKNHGYINDKNRHYIVINKQLNNHIIDYIGDKNKHYIIMDKKLENNIIDFIHYKNKHYKHKHDNIEIVSIEKYHNIHYKEMMMVTYNFQITYSSNNKGYVSFTYPLIVKELKKFIIQKRNDKILNILK